MATSSGFALPPSKVPLNFRFSLFIAGVGYCQNASVSQLSLFRAKTSRFLFLRRSKHQFLCADGGFFDRSVASSIDLGWSGRKMLISIADIRGKSFRVCAKDITCRPIDQVWIWLNHWLLTSSNVVKVNEIRVIAVDVLSRESITGLILVLQSHITDQALKAIELFSFKVEFFQITDLLVNVTKHVLRPKHQVLTDKEKESLLKKFSIEEKQLPRIMKKDPIVRYYGLEKGQVVKVTYKDELNKSHATYRCVS